MSQHGAETFTAGDVHPLLAVLNVFAPGATARARPAAPSGALRDSAAAPARRSRRSGSAPTERQEA